MRKVYPHVLLFLCASVFQLFIGLNAQTVQIGTGTDITPSTLYSPLYRFSATSTTTGSRANILITQAEMAAAGIPSGAIITSVEFNKTNVANFTTPCTYTMYMANTTNTALATTLTWASIQSTHTQVFTSSSFNVPSAAGWVAWNVTPFTYTGGALEIANECTMGGNGAATDAFKWEYTASIPTDRIVGVASPTGTTLNGTVATYKFRPNIKITFIPASACTSPPTAGTSTSSVTGGICSGTSVTLGLTGNSSGSGQTYQWQSSPTLAGTYTNIGTSSNTTTLNINPTSTAYYRCVVTCGSSSSNSTPVQVVVNGLFAGGTYTINSGAATSGSNFSSFSAAVNAFKCGIAGNVQFNVLAGSGPYNEQIVIPAIANTSITNQIVFMCNGVNLNYSTTDASNRAAVLLNGADYVTIDSLKIDVSGSSTAGWGIALTGKADSNIIRKCNINVGNLTSTSTNFMGIALNGSTTSTATSGDNGNGNQFLNNTISGGYYGIYLYGSSSSTTQNINNVARGNVIRDIYNYAIYAGYMSNGLIISSNDITRPTRTTSTTTAGIFLTTGNAGALIEKNKVHNLFEAITTNTSTTYGIYVSSSATSTAPNKLHNNLIYNIGGNGTVYGIYNTGGDYMQAYHNTISLDDNVATTGTAYGIYQTGAAAGVDVRNNIINIARTGTGIKRGIYYLTTTSTITSNYNNIFLTGSLSGTDNRIVQFGTTSYADLAAWQASNSNAYDQQSLSIDPTFVNSSTGNYTPSVSGLNNTATPLGVLTDILNNTRSITNPDAGAYEFSLLTSGLNFGAESLVNPAISLGGCYTNAETVKIKIRNSSTNTHDFSTNPVTVTVNVTGAITQTLTTTINTGILTSDNTLEVTLPGTINMSANGVYNFTASTSLTGDVNTSNDAMLPTTRTKVALATGTATISSNNICAVGGVLPTLNASGTTGYSNLQWQVSNTTGTGFTNITGGTTLPYTLTGSITQNQYYKLGVTCGTTTSFSNEVLLNYVSPTILSTSPFTRCSSGSVTLGATASTGSTVNWYNAASGGTSIATGNTYTTPTLTATTTYYVSATTSGSNEDIASPTVGTSSFWTATAGWGLRFTVNNTATIRTVKMYPSNSTAGAASIQVKVTDLADVVLYTGTLNNFTVGTAAAEQLIQVGITLPPGDYKMVMTSTGINNLIRESSGVTFPYTATSNAITITAGANGSGTAQTTSAYYWFYAWNISTGCESNRTAVTATIDNSPTCVATPITLLSFSGNKIGAINKLEWITANEINNAGFELQRSIDGYNFSNIGYVGSKSVNGNSNTQLTYVFNDTKPLITNNYYRLRQLDKDGKSSFSPIVLIKGMRPNTLSVSPIYPNPSNEQINVLVSSPTTEKLKLIITDITGKVLLLKEQVIQQGENQVQLNISKFSKGNYFLKTILENGSENFVQKFIKQ